MIPSTLSKVLIVQEFGIGDFVLSTPAIAGVKNRFPKSQLLVLLPKNVSSLSRLVPQIDECVSFEPQYVNAIKLALGLRSEYYEAIIILNPGYIGYWIGAICQARIKVGYRSPLQARLSRYRENRIHEVDRYIGIINKLGITPDFREPFLQIPHDVESYALRVIKSDSFNSSNYLVGLVVGAGLTHKRWPLENFARLADWLVDTRSAEVIFFGNESDTAIVTDIMGLMENNAISLSGKLSLEESAYMIGRCNLVISNDTGLMHIAAALGIPVIALFGPTNPYRFAPINNTTIILKKDYPCSPCNLQHSSKCPDNICMRILGVEQVIEIIEQRFGYSPSLEEGSPIHRNKNKVI